MLKIEMPSINQTIWRRRKNA